VFYALGKSYSFLTPDLWAETFFVKSPLQVHSEFLKQTKEENKTEK